MKKKEAVAICEKYSLSPNKRLGQNFLIDEGITDKILGLIAPAGDDVILEIGPGLGTLTGRLAEKAGHLTAVEIDSGLFRYLCCVFAGNAGIKLVHGDFLKYRPDKSFTKTISNLPYYCAAEILFRTAELLEGSAYVMLQREMAERIIAEPGGKAYGALTVAIGCYYAPKFAFPVPKEAFWPRPDVDSVFVELKRRAWELSEKERQIFRSLVKSAFWGRRKTLRKALAESPHFSMDREQISAALLSAGIDDSIRGEELSRRDFQGLAKAFGQISAN